MTDLAIQAEHLGKQYRIGEQEERYQTLRDTLVRTAGKSLRRLRAVARGQGANVSRQTIWALKDVSFDVQFGEVVGIIGRNGAGKSTLLKILSRVTPPTTGRARIRGRIGSLLEVGTGFHPELTGRENTSLYGAILGMTRAEIARKFDEIVAFAEVERFIDTPVKHYSSGMYLRLAFAVAAHLETEILLVDEVLAVGDSRFQEKCLGKMGDVARSEGRTVLFVSHSMAAIQQLCKTGILLDAGQIAFLGSAQQAIARYVESTSSLVRGTELRDRLDRRGNRSLCFTGVAIVDARNNAIDRVLSGEDIRLRFYYESAVEAGSATVNIAFNVYNPQGVLLTNLNSKDVDRMTMPVGRTGYFECAWPRFSLRSGVYTCSLFCEINGQIVDWLQSAFQIHVEDGNFFGTGSLISRNQGDVLVGYDWTAQVTPGPEPNAETRDESTLP